MSFELPVEQGKIREFAIAAMSTDPAYDDADAVVTPTFLTVGRMRWEPLDRPVAEQLGFDVSRVLHAEEDYEFHGPVPRAGAVLTGATEIGERWEKVGRRGGRLRFGVVRTTYRDADGRLVATQHTTVVETEGAPS